MKKHLNIDLNTLPEEGKTFSGELDGSILTTRHGSAGEIKAVSPLVYDLYLQKFDNELLVRGNLSATFEFNCDRCLSPFDMTIEAVECSLCIEVGSSQIDLADALREEIVILFPDYPHCEDGDEPNTCNLDSRYLAMDKPLDDDVKTRPRDEAPTPWDALDAIKDDPSEGSE
ncbi:MAG: DUF177 domain-containing protein [Akkermansiaceae bacterium]|nr:DUF177 domain-containing protein [Akkermansiaceae bacterium]